MLRALLRIALLIAWFVLSLLQQTAGFLLGTGDGRHLRLRFYRGALRILGIRIRVFHDFSPRRPLCIVANHVSYLDVFVLGSLIPAVFVAKKEVREWPVIGWIAWLQRTIFIERRRSKADDEIRPLVKALNRGSNVIVFPEGNINRRRNHTAFQKHAFRSSKTSKCLCPTCKPHLP